jgi:hypothetical protein
LSFSFSFAPLEPETKTLSFGMNEKDDVISAETANEEGNSEEENSDGDDESNSGGEDSYSDLASSNDEEEEQEDVETESKSIEGKVDVLDNKKKAGEIPFVFKGNPIFSKRETFKRS